MMTRVAIVTGANKGVGFAIVRYLCRNFDGDVYLTARDENRGRAAVAELEKECVHPLFYRLDITDQHSVDNLAAFLKDRYGGLDILVNNAAILYTVSSVDPEETENTMNTNFWGTVRVCDALFPLLRPHARVVNVSSNVSARAFNNSNAVLKSRIKTCKTYDDVTSLMNEFVSAVKDTTYKDKGWPQTAYGVSKIGISAITEIQQRLFDSSGKEDIIINCCCPGYVDTDMSKHLGTKTIDEGADTPCYLALLPQDVREPRGMYLSDRTVMEWAQL